jgi:flagellar biosynthesis anti-sigma factor FlgM
MKINDSNVHINFEAYAQRTKNALGAQEQSSAVSGDSTPVDKVVLSPKAREIQEARQLLDELPDVNEPKVAHIRLQIDKGVYKIDGSQIAERMMRDMALNNDF